MIIVFDLIDTLKKKNLLRTNTMSYCCIANWHRWHNPYQEFIEFVLNKYVETGVGELDQEKLPVLLTNKYQSLEDAKDILEMQQISASYL